MNKLVSSEKINILKVNIVNFIEQVMIILQKMYSILMMSISKFFKQAKIYAKDNINTIFSYSFFKGLFVKIFMLLFSCWIYNDLEPAIREFILKHISDKLILISNIVENNISVNIFIVIVICIACYQLCCKIWRNIYYSVSRLLVGSFLLFVLSFEEFWDYNKLPLIDFYYDDLFRSVICIMLVVDILKTIVYSYCKIKKYNSQKGKVFFTNDKIENYIEQALFYARSNTVEKDYYVKKVDLKEIVNNAILKNKRNLIQNKINVKTYHLDEEVFTDSKWCIFIINQIIQNSIKYSKKENKEIEIYSVDKNEKVVLYIKDNGIGIKKGEITKVFEKGFTGENGRQIGKKSTGIGLYLCKKLCDKLGLGIEFNSNKDEGSIVNLVFPKSSFTNI